MNDTLRIACLKIALQRAFLGRVILRVILSLGIFVYLYLYVCILKNHYSIVHMT